MTFPLSLRARPRRLISLAATLGCILFALTLPAGASAVTYQVDSKGDEPDAAVGVNGCKTAANVCSLRAAIQESNISTSEDDLIGFDGAIFNGEPGDTVTLTSALPAITDRAGINGSYSCVVGVLSAPCAEVAAPSNASVLTIEADNVWINGLSLTGGQTGINVINNSQTVEVTGNWIGVKLDLSDGGNSGRGIFVDPDSNGAVIGGSSLGQRNVISNNGVGVDVEGADNAVIQGNFFGVQPDGQAQAANSKNIEITDSTASPGFKAENNEIGKQLFPGVPPTIQCDEGCNVISGSTIGVDLNGDPSVENEEPASGPTVIHSNYIGLNAAGTGVVANDTTFGIMVGAAEKTVIGGPSVSGAVVNVNRLAGGEYGIFATEAEDLEIQLNTIGASPVGAVALPPTAVGIFVLALGVTEPTTIEGNFVRMLGGVGIEQRFVGSVISRNTILGGGIGIRTTVSGGQGSRIEYNGIENVAGNGILIEDDGNQMLGNIVRGSGEAGIRIQTPLDEGKLPSTGNVIGGQGGDENFISESGGDAIEISNLEQSDNEVRGNYGGANAGSFIDLVPANPGTEPNGPNHGIKPPTISSAFSGAASGSALPGSKVLVFRKDSASPGEIKSFLGEAIADGSGGWKVEYEEDEEAVTVPVGGNLAALQTSPGGASSELALSVVVPVPDEGSNGGGGGAGGPAPLPAADRTAPQTRITKGPKGKSSKRKAKFRFSASEARSKFECKLDRKRFRSCRSPKKYSGLKPGRHVFRVRAVDAAGNIDPSPAKRVFRVTG